MDKYIAKNKQRDEFIDLARGIAMLWVIFVHALYWINLYSWYPINVIKSFVLIEMPVFFFITGATTQLSPCYSYKNFVTRRVGGMLIPYWIYALTCIVTTLVYLAIQNTSVEWATYIPKLLFSWIIPADKQMSAISMLPSALWFVPIYVVCMFITPLIICVKRKCGSKMISAFICIYILSTFTHCDFLIKTAFYLFWIYAGTLHPEIKNLFRKRRKVYNITFILIMLIGIVLMICCRRLMNYSFDMQNNKFPPNIMFFSYSMVFFSCLFLAAKPIMYIIKMVNTIPVVRAILKRFSLYSVTIFLYHPFSFCAAYVIERLSGIYALSDEIRLVYYLFMCVSGSIVLSYLFGWIQKIRGFRK